MYGYYFADIFYIKVIFTRISETNQIPLATSKIENVIQRNSFVLLVAISNRIRHVQHHIVFDIQTKINANCFSKIEN